MATNTPAPNDASPPLWQAPVFVLGVAAFLAAWFGRPLFPDRAAGRLDADLANARQLLQRPDGDAEQALKLARAALESNSLPPGRSGEAAFLAGSAAVRLAEKVDPVRSKDTWLKAKEFFDQAASDGVAYEDRADLAFRVAKVALLTNEDPTSVLVRLEQSVPNCSSRAEGYRLLSEAYLRLPKPDLEKAMAANLKLRDVPDAEEAELALAKLQGGEILLRMGKPDEARSALEKIGEQASPAVVIRARLLRARTYQEEQKWGEAVRLYTAALADGRASAADPAPVHYHLGQCFRALDQPEQAAKELLNCVRLSRGPEGTAAALALAEQRLAEQALEPALDMLTQAVARVTSFADWRNPFVDLKKARETFEAAVLAARKSARHDLALKLLEPYAKLAPPRRVLALRGELASEWARAKLEAPATPEVDRQIDELFRLAGDAYAKAAALKELTLADKGEFLWLAARSYVDGKDDARATVLLEQVVTLNLEPARLGEAWHRLFTIYRFSGKAESAQRAALKCLEYDTPFAHRIRHAMAMGKLESGDVDEAEKILVMNVKLLRWESDPDAMAESLFALSNLLYQRKDFRRVVPYLENTLGRFRNNPELTKARYLLADSYRQIASQENQSYLLSEGMSDEAKAHFQTEHTRLLKQAAEEFSALLRVLESPEGKDHLTPELRAQVPMVTAKCLYNANRYADAQAIFEMLIQRHEGKVEALEAAGGAVSCHAALKDNEKVRQRLLQIKLMLPRMEEEVRKPWEEWLADANKALNEP